MAANKQLTERIRISMQHIKNIEEKRMFSGITFMVNGKMCISVGNDSIMVRIDPLMYQELIRKSGVSPVIMKDHTYKGYVNVNEDVLDTDEDLHYWVHIALEFNKKLLGQRK